MSWEPVHEDEGQDHAWSLVRQIGWSPVLDSLDDCECLRVSICLKKQDEKNQMAFAPPQTHKRFPSKMKPQSELETHVVVGREAP